MDTVSFPDQPRKRRNIVVLSPFEYKRLQYEPWGRPLLLDVRNAKAHIFVPSKTDDSHPVVRNLIQKGLDNEGMLLVQNPYDFADYEEVDKASSTFALTKWSYFVTYCEFLGVKNVNIEQLEVSSISGEDVYSGQLDTTPGGANLEAKTTVGALRRDLIRIKRTLPESERDTNAAEYYRQEHLWSDPLVKSLLDLRPKGTYELEFNLTQEVKRSLDVAIGLNIPRIPGNIVYANLKAKIDKTKEESYEYKLLVSLGF